MHNHTHACAHRERHTHTYKTSFKKYFKNLYKPRSFVNTKERVNKTLKKMNPVINKDNQTGITSKAHDSCFNVLKLIHLTITLRKIFKRQTKISSQ